MTSFNVPIPTLYTWAFCLDMGLGLELMKLLLLRMDANGWLGNKTPKCVDIEGTCYLDSGMSRRNLYR